jgi:DNA-binding transcriptional ArsR family regulator
MEESGQNELPTAIDWERLARAETHPLRMSILELLAMDGGRTLSPNELSCELQIPLAKVMYHTGELAKGGVIRLFQERKVGGTVEHFYCLPSHSGDDLVKRFDFS